MLQTVIRTAFSSSPLFAITHHLDTMLDSDKNLVLANGQVVEYASPQQLVTNASGQFFYLMQENEYLIKFDSSKIPETC